MGAVVGGELQYPGSSEVMREFDDVADAGSAEAVYALVVVAYDGDVAVGFGDLE